VTRFAQQWFLPQVGGQFVAGGGFPGLTGPQIRKVVSLMRPAIISAIFKELGVRQADSGAWLPPHSVAAFHNNTDKWEPVGPPGAPPDGRADGDHRHAETGRQRHRHHHRPDHPVRHPRETLR
jgi:hypothetical protein